MSEFIDQMAELSITENGAVGYATTKHPLLDMNFKVPSYRSANPESIVRDFSAAYAEDPELAVRWAFYVSDVRGGLGERSLARILFAYIADKIADEKATQLFEFIAEYNRYDSLFALLDTTKGKQLVEWLHTKLMADVNAANNGEPVSLLAKWMPSINTSSVASCKLAKRFVKEWGITPKCYRVMLSTLRKKLNLVETEMCKKNWGEINYSAVPSKANIKYNKAFLKNDEDRRRKFLADVNKGDAKINAATLFPHDIVHQYGIWNHRGKPVMNEALEALWKALPNTLIGDKKLMVIRDGSGSMECVVDRKSSVRATDIATALTIYCAERLNGAYKNRFITFSSRPQIVDLSGCDTLADKLGECASYTDISNTDIQKVMELVLATAVKNKVAQEDIPDLLIVSDMEFDGHVCYGCNAESRNRSMRYDVNVPADVALFDHISTEFKEAGYKMPRLIFWNVNSRTNTIPVTENEMGVALVSGFSQNILKMVCGGDLDPWMLVVNALNVPRYDPVASLLN